jgi:CHAT domain-containing protein
MIGSAVTADAVARAFGHAGILLLSLHGAFDAENPFHSKIVTADGHFPLHQLLLGQTSIKSRMVVLGVCEAGRVRRSLSDEPLGFPAMLLQSGVTAVLAPAWQVDDFASFLFISKMFEAINRGTTIFHAARDTTRWLREVTAQSVLEQTDNLMDTVIDSGEQGKIAAAALQPRLQKHKAWLETLKPTERPFRSPLDWAAFQITGVPPVSAPA